MMNPPASRHIAAVRVPAAAQPIPGAVVRTAPAIVEQLLRLAAARPELSWPLGADIAIAKNAHNTNTPAEMKAALQADYTFLEGDVRIEPSGTVVMAHDKGGRDGLTLAEWLAVGGRSGRGLKVDIKERSAVLPTVRMARMAGVPDERFLINVTVSGDPGANVTPEQLREIRQLYPRAIINLSVSEASYSPALLRNLGRIAQSIGQPVMFPLRWDLTGPNAITALRPYGKIAIWNSPRLAPKDIPAEILRLRAMGVDGMIDLRN